MSSKTYDAIIIGSGPAGISASIYLSRANLKTIVIGRLSESGLYFSPVIENYPGFPDGISGKELMQNFKVQAVKYGVEFIEGETISVSRQPQEEFFRVKLDDGTEFEARTIIVSCGKAPKTSGIRGEENLKGRGVHYCVACDGYFYKNKKVAVLGNGNYAAEEAIELTSYTKDITIISNGLEFEFSPQLKAIVEKEEIKLSKEKIKEIVGEKNFECLLNSKDEKLVFDGVFIALGSASSMSFANALGLETFDVDLLIDRDGRTNIKGVYGAGTCTGGNSQITKSVGEGTNAAISIIKDLKGLTNYIDHT